MADGVGHGHHRQAEGEGNADEADAEVDGGGIRSEEHRCEDRTAAAAEDEPEGAEEFC